MQMMMGARQKNQTQTTLDLNVVTVVLTTLPSGEGVKLGSSFVTHAVCTLVFGESLDLSRSRETKFGHDLNTFPSEYYIPSTHLGMSELHFYWVTTVPLILFDTAQLIAWTLNEKYNNNIGLSNENSR